MDLLHALARERAQKRHKRQLVPGLFARVGGLVRMGALDWSFVETLEAISRELPGGAGASAPWRPKPAYRPPLFPLVTEEEYRITMAILDKVPAAYLAFANSPEEILLCGPLFRRNPSLGPGELAGTHFATLLAAQMAEAGPQGSRTGDAARGG